MNPNPLNLAITVGTTAVSTALPFCSPVISTTGSTNVFIGKKPAVSLGDAITSVVPVIPLVLPEPQRFMIAQYLATSGGATSVEATPPTVPVPTVFTWLLRTMPSTIPGSCSKSVFINKKPAIRAGDTILPLTFKWIPTQFNVFIGN